MRHVDDGGRPTKVDPDNAAPLLMGLVHGVVEQELANLQDMGLNISKVRLVRDSDGQVEAMEYEMATGTYLVRIEKTAAR